MADPRPIPKPKPTPNPPTGVPIKPSIPRPDELPMVIENGKIICNLEFASILSSLSQKSINVVFIINYTIESSCSICSASNAIAK